MKNGLRWLALLSTCGALALVFYVYQRRDDSTPVGSQPPPTDVTLASTAPNHVPPINSALTSDNPAELTRYHQPVRDKARASVVREALIAQKAQKLGALPADDAQGLNNEHGKRMPESEGSGNQVGKPLGEYVNRVMQQQFVPMATECYENLLAQHPTIAGNVELTFSILGDVSVGGVVVDVNLGPNTTLTDPQFRTCMTESMLAVVFEAPPGDDGSVTVTQSFELAP